MHFLHKVSILIVNCIIVFSLSPAECQSLQEVDLSWNCIRMKGAIDVAQGVKVGSPS